MDAPLPHLNVEVTGNEITRLGSNSGNRRRSSNPVGCVKGEPEGKNLDQPPRMSLAKMENAKVMKSIRSWYLGRGGKSSHQWLMDPSTDRGVILVRVFCSGRLMICQPGATGLVFLFQRDLRMLSLISCNFLCHPVGNLFSVGPVFSLQSYGMQ